MSRAFLAVPPVILAAALVVAGACQDLPPIQLCGEIPGEGCPLGAGGTCDDLTCTGLYDCVGGHWTLSQVCPAPDGGPGGDGGDGGPGGDGGCVTVTVDAGPLGFGCTPDNQAPDCPFAAVGCAESACFNGCTDFFLCVEGPCGGPGPCWKAVAYCDDEGMLVLSGQ